VEGEKKKRQRFKEQYGYLWIGSLTNILKRVIENEKLTKSKNNRFSQWRFSGIAIFSILILSILRIPIYPLLFLIVFGGGGSGLLVSIYSSWH